MNKEELTTLPMPQGTSQCSCLEHALLLVCIGTGQFRVNAKRRCLGTTRTTAEGSGRIAGGGGGALGFRESPSALPQNALAGDPGTIAEESRRGEGGREGEGGGSFLLQGTKLCRPRFTSG